MNNRIINTKDLLKKTNLLAKFGNFFTPVSFAILIITAGIAIMVIKILLDSV